MRTRPRTRPRPSGSAVVSISTRAVWARWALASASGPAPSSARSWRSTCRAAVAEPGGEPRHALAVDDAVRDEPHGPGDGVRAGVPLRGAGAGVGPAPLAGPETGLLAGGGARVEGHVPRLGRHDRAARAAVDPGGQDRGEEPAVEAGVLRLHGPYAALGVGVHAPSIGHAGAGRLAEIRHRSRAENPVRPSVTVHMNEQGSRTHVLTRSRQVPTVTESACSPLIMVSAARPVHTSELPGRTDTAPIWRERCRRRSPYSRAPPCSPARSSPCPAPWRRPPPRPEPPAPAPSASWPPTRCTWRRTAATTRPARSRTRRRSPRRSAVSPRAGRSTCAAGRTRTRETVTIPPGNDGTSGARTTLAAYPDETPVLNFSAMSEDPANRGLAVNGAYWHVDGIVVEHAGDNGIFVGGSNNVVEHTSRASTTTRACRSRGWPPTPPTTSGPPTTSS